MNDHEDGGSRKARTQHEDAFLTRLLGLINGLDVWLHEDEDSTPWLTLSHDFVPVPGRGIERVARLDYDALGRLRGGWSPAGLNWDDGVRAEAATVETRSADGLHTDEQDPERAAQLAADWFSRLGVQVLQPWRSRPRDIEERHFFASSAHPLLVDGAAPATFLGWLAHAMNRRAR